MYRPFAQPTALSRPDSGLATPSPSQWTPRTLEALSFFDALRLDDKVIDMDVDDGDGDDSELAKIFPEDAMDTKAPATATATDVDHLSHVFFRALNITPEEVEEELRQQLAGLIAPKGTGKTTPVPESAPSRKRGAESDQTFFHHPNKMRRTTYEPNGSLPHNP